MMICRAFHAKNKSCVRNLNFEDLPPLFARLQWSKIPQNCLIFKYSFVHCEIGSKLFQMKLRHF